MICENIPRYGVIVVVVVIVTETKETSEIEKFRAEISDMFLKKFIVTETNVQIIFKRARDISGYNLDWLHFVKMFQWFTMR